MTGEQAASFKGARVLVIGDVMLDRFVYARVSRISPEAPVPVLAVQREIVTLGGAGNVARNVASLGGRATLVGRRGDDHAGELLKELLQREPDIQDALLTCAAGRTIEKIRYIAEQQQVMRADYEFEVGAAVAFEDILATVRGEIAEHDALVISDYAKGMLPPALVEELIALARAAQIPVVVDPKGLSLDRYNGATVITPNHHEAAAATGLDTETDQGIELCLNRMLAMLPGSGAILITRGALGMALAERGRAIEHIPARRREVFDVSGAGDTVVAALALALGAKGSLEAAARFANVAAGVAVTRVGTAAVTADEVAAAFHARQLESVEKKVASRDRVTEWADIWRGQSRKIGFTNGCFDLLHPGHVSLLTQARAQCDRLIVGINSDASVKRLKGAGRPVQDETARALVLASLAMVDLVVIFDEDTPETLIKSLRPDLLVKGADYRLDQIVGADFVASYGGKVLIAALVPGRSTSSLLTRVAGPLQ
jgi:D-beta-D-heptose 7-phosphate kinase/D-beta-D-heptose 1-phosphate adenosyltransferase